MVQRSYGICGRGGLIEKCLGILENQLDGREYIAGAFSLADLFYGPLLHYLNMLPESGRMIAASPRLARYGQRLWSRPAFKATTPPPLPVQTAAAAD